MRVYTHRLVKTAGIDTHQKSRQIHNLFQPGLLFRSFRGSSTAERFPVKEVVGGSNPSLGAYDAKLVDLRTNSNTIFRERYRLHKKSVCFSFVVGREQLLLSGGFSTVPSKRDLDETSDVLGNCFLPLWLNGKAVACKATSQGFDSLRRLHLTERKLTCCS